ncbi:MAG: DNA polymerase III subunit alpha [Candidatus Tokpelaia sp. JSC161]|nr:MAG: DNA polymerase III subunit alpha [Candidatus Tokpelaia sp. JSC161]
MSIGIGSGFKKVLKDRYKLIQPSFIHLRVHSAYSLLEGALKIDKIIAHALADKEPAIAMTDSNNLFGAIEFSQKCFEVGLQPLVGCQLMVDFEDKKLDFWSKKVFSGLPSLVFLAATNKGYANLVRLVSRAYLEKSSLTDLPHLRIASLNKDSVEGIIALTGGPGGPLDQALVVDRWRDALKRLDILHALFPHRLYIELQRHGNYDLSVEDKIINLAYEKKLPLVATNEAFFLKPEDYEAHDVLLAIAEGKLLSAGDRRKVTQEHYLKSQKEMVELFRDLPEALDHTVEIAKRCHVAAPIRKPILPRFIDVGGHHPDSLIKEEGKEMERQARDGLLSRLKLSGFAEGYCLKDYKKRLEYEISVIVKMKFPGYFLIVSDFIKWAKAQRIPVGPGRGSGAGSLVAYALMITDVDPLRFSLLFERFLNPDRVSMPDFDIDFCQERREEIIQYVQKKYGHEQVAQIITFGTLQARAVLRDVGRVLDMPYSQVDRLTKLIPLNSANPLSLAQAVADEPKFEEERQKDPIIGRLIDISTRLEGLYRHASTHAAGIVIGDRPLWELVPMYRDTRSDIPITQFNMKYIEQAGLVKFDFLGLKTLTVLRRAVDLIERSKGIKIDLSHLSLDDQSTYAMLGRGETVGIFQLESAGMRKALIGMRPDRIEDIIALVALYRPGPMENIQTYNARKHGEERIISIHPQIDSLLEETQGVIVYQEQVMQIAQVLSGYSLGEADLLRRAMGKKIRKEMESQRIRFVNGALKGGLREEKAHVIFDVLAKFADYGFNKSHAAAYAILSYQTAYLKAHYPVEFLAASMTYDISNIEKLNDFRQEAERLGITIVAPSVQTSFRFFEVNENQIYYSLAAIKGVGEPAVDHILASRANKLFSSLEDFCQRTDPRIINRRVWEGLISAGAFDSFEIQRETLMAGLDNIIAYTQRLAKDANSGQFDMFRVLNASKDEIFLPDVKSWIAGEKLHHEFQSIGFYLSAHPLDEYQSLLMKMRVQTWDAFSKAMPQGFSLGRLAGTVNARKIRKTRSGNKVGIIYFSDASGKYEALLFSEGINQYFELLEPGRSVLITVNAENKPEGITLKIQNVQSLEDEAGRLQKSMRLYVSSSDAIKKIVPYLQSQGQSEVSLILLKDEEYEVEVILGGRFKIGPRIASAVQAIHGVDRVELI